MNWIYRLLYISNNLNNEIKVDKWSDIIDYIVLIIIRDKNLNIWLYIVINLNKLCNIWGEDRYIIDYIYQIKITLWYYE